MKTYSLEEAGTMLGLSVVTLRRYLKEGKLKGSKMGKAWRLTEEQIKKCFDNHSIDKNSDDKEKS